jgi:hypothetical protein
VTAGLVERLDDAMAELIAYRTADPRLIVMAEEKASTIGVGIGSFDGYRGTLRRVAVAERWRSLGSALGSRPSSSAACCDAAQGAESPCRRS